MFRPSIRQMSYLLALHERGSFNAAAEECAVTQSTLSAGIKEMEEILGRQLVIRNRKKTVLSPFGLEVAEQVKTILNQTDKIVSRAKLLEEPLSGPLRLGIIPTIAPYMLPDLLPKWNDEFPRLELQLHEDLTDRLLESLRKNQIDVALMAFPYDTPNMTQAIVFEEYFYAAISEQAHHAADTIQLSDLEPDKLLLLEDGHCLRDHALSACDLQLPKQRKTFSATSLPTLIHMVRHGFGMTLLPEMACTPENLPKGVRLIPFNGKTKPTRQIGLCWRENDPRTRDFDLLAKSLR